MNWRFDNEGYFGNDKTYCIPTSDLYLLGLLNSAAIWFLLCGMAPPVRGGYLELRVHYMERLPIPDASAEERDRVSAIVGRCIALSGDVRSLDEATRRRILDLTPEHSLPFGKKLRDWWELKFKDFSLEVKARFKKTIPVAERGEWEEYLATQQAEMSALLQRLIACQADLDEAVFDVFVMSPSDRKTIQSVVGSAFGFGEAKSAFAAVA